MNYTLSVIVPFLNEEKFIEKSIERLLNTDLFKEIILVNDASVDKSPSIANSYTEKYENIQLINLTNQSGKGRAVQKGIEIATSTHVVVHDADLEYFPDDLIEMFKLIKTNSKSLILGSRTLKGQKRDNKYKLTFYGNKYLTALFSLVNFYKVSDIASCYWIIERELINNMDLVEKGFAIEVEVLSKFLKTKNKIIEYPIKYTGRTYAEGKKIVFSDGLKIFLKILKYSKLFSFFKFI